jgi:hypothetical protein
MTKPRKKLGRPRQIQEPQVILSAKIRTSTKQNIDRARKPGNLSVRQILEQRFDA